MSAPNTARAGMWPFCIIKLCLHLGDTRRDTHFIHLWIGKRYSTGSHSLPPPLPKRARLCYHFPLIPRFGEPQDHPPEPAQGLYSHICSHPHIEEPQHAKGYVANMPVFGP